jgi:hypothetical protein
VRVGHGAGRLALFGELHLDDLGPGWEGATRALADVQHDLSRTVAHAPTIKLLWRDLSEDDDVSSAEPSERRWAYVGKGPDWYFGANGGFELPRDYASAVVEIATDLSDAIADTLLGYFAYWPHCPDDDHLLTVHMDERRRCWWVCRDRAHAVAEIGQLPGST